MLRIFGLIAFAALVVVTPPQAVNENGRLQAAPVGARHAFPDGSPIERLSVLTYNIHGLPEPLGNSEATLSAISDRLRALRSAGRQPNIVLLQEAFTDEAKKIGRDAGYRYVMEGPTASELNAAHIAGAATPLDRETHWWVGEGDGKLVDSGLMILSDYPVTAARRLAFPEKACAGYDCLSNKGMLLVTIRLPGQPVPVDVVTTHFNSRSAAGVSHERSLIAYRRQADALFAFLAATRNADRPLVLAGDFNIGKDLERRSAVFAKLSSLAAAQPLKDAVAGVTQRFAAAVPADLREARARAKDWQFWADGRKLKLEPVAIKVPFGRAPDGSMLSDHIGFAAEYALLPTRRRAS